MDPDVDKQGIHKATVNVIDHLFYHNALIQLVIALSIIGTIIVTVKIYIDNTRGQNNEKRVILTPSPPTIADSTDHIDITNLPTPTIMSRNTMYENELLQFSFEYSNQLNLTINENLFFSGNIRMISALENDYPLISIRVYQLDTDIPEQWIQLHGSQAPLNVRFFPGASNIKERSHNNLSTFEFDDIIPDQQIATHSVVFFQNGYAYVFTNNYVTNNPYFEPILESFHFTTSQ